MKEKPVVNLRSQGITKQRIIEDLRKIGIAEGDHLAVALSLKSVGYVIGGPATFIQALLDILGSDGTIMMNTSNHGFPLSEIARDYVYDRKSTPCETGVVPETLRKWKGAIRSKNPVDSVTAIGRLAEYLTSGHDEQSSLYGPYSRLAAVGGKYLCIGLKNNLVAIRHEAQHLAGLDTIIKKFFGVLYIDNCGMERVYVYNHPPCTGGLPNIVLKLEASGILRVGKIGNARTYLASAKELLNNMTEMLIANPRLTMCDSIRCVWCREAERKLNIYPGKSEAKFFQKNFFFVTVLRLINMFRLKRYLFLSFRKRNSCTESNHSVRGILADLFNLCYLAVVGC
jgi:aminoglycoside 3-N-acetyltransferase